MIELIIKWWVQIRGRFSSERGITTLDYIGLTAVVLMFLTIIIVYFQTQGCTTIGKAVGDSFQAQIDAWK